MGCRGAKAQGYFDPEAPTAKCIVETGLDREVPTARCSVIVTMVYPGASK